eukprot:SAG31_NODE_3_length_45830_cov_42.279701_14_plen_163_part_00
MGALPGITQRSVEMSHVSSAGSFAFSFEPIGYIESCFSRLRAIPRQGALAPATRANLVLAPGLQSCTVEGLEQFSHVWITFVFHDNTVATNKARPTIDRGRAGTGQGNGFAAGDYRAKIMPPKYGHKVGVFATRSPHRFASRSILCRSILCGGSVKGSSRLW